MQDSLDLKMPEDFREDEICGTEVVVDRFNCQKCNKLAIYPYFCNGCGYQYCKKCIKKKKCIRGCSNSKFSPICQKERDLLNTIRLKCKNNECKEFINYFDYVKHLRKCKYSLYH